MRVNDERQYALEMMGKPERRDRLDRRKASRGGRRPDDKAGSAPLVLVVGDPQERESDCCTILARLRFAVAPAADVADALRVIDAVHPDLIVARPAVAGRLREDAAISLPIVEFDAGSDRDDALLDRIRRAVTARRSEARPRST
jgi:hypothetical protein